MLSVYILALFLSFYLLAKIVDEYFVESLDQIAKKLKMSSDAAGATLMAVGSSAPELFVALFAVFYPTEAGEASKAGIGIGSIVGSALFNLLVITGAAAFVRKAKIAWQPVIRDLFFYAVAIVVLIFVFRDGNVSLMDTIMFLGVYVAYVIAVIFWRKILKYEDPNEIDVDELKSPDKAEEQENRSLFSKIMKPVDWILGLLFPPAKYYGWIFTISILIIAALSWVLVESAVGVSAILSIPESIIALTVLAVGTSVPDLLSSVLVSKQGRGGMAISNAVGSNIFDILVGLGLPFLLIILMSGNSLDLDVLDLETSIYFLFGSVGLVLLLFLVSRWNVGKMTGIILIGLYCAYVGWAIFNIK